uniref:Putative lipocalin-6 1 n=1 Tax=Amblyomma parvum TaxID=251391 RepID=A0A023FTU3_AMBPA
MPFFDTILKCFFLTLLLNEISSETIQTASIVSGWDFIQVKVQLNLNKTNIDTSKVRNATNCTSVNTLWKNESDHTAFEVLTSYLKETGTWFQVNETFRFYNQSGIYDYMNATSHSGGPAGAYQFLFTDDNCTVVQVLSIQFETHERALGENYTYLDERNDRLCHQWVKNGTMVSEDCDNFFMQNCNNQTVYRDYDYNCTELLR